MISRWASLITSRAIFTGPAGRRPVTEYIDGVKHRPVRRRDRGRDRRFSRAWLMSPELAGAEAVAVECWRRRGVPPRPHAPYGA